MVRRRDEGRRVPENRVWVVGRRMVVRREGKEGKKGVGNRWRIGKMMLEGEGGH